MNLDFYIFNSINQFAGKSVCLDSLVVFFAEYLGYFLAVSVIFLFWKKWKIIVQSFSAAIIARFGIVELIRFFWHRSRPFIENNVNLLLNHENSYSFPSGHATFFFALSFVIYKYNKKAGIFFFIASFLISVARVFCGVHWPSDILAGAIVGIIIGWFVLFLDRKFSLTEKIKLLR